MNQLLQAMNQPDKGALYWDNLACSLDSNKENIFTHSYMQRSKKKKEKEL